MPTTALLQRLRLWMPVALLIDSARQWSRHRASSKGAALALYMMLSLAPMLILVIAMAGTFFGEDAVRMELVGQLRSLVGERGAEAIQIVLASAHESGSGWLAALISVMLLVVGATTAFAELKRSLDELWEVPPGSAAGGLSGMVRERVLSFGVVLALALFLLLSLALNATLAGLRHYYAAWWDMSVFATLADWASNLFSFAIVTALFAVVYKILPAVHIPWRDVLPGAVMTAALFLVGKWGIGLYLGRGAAVSAYGAAGSVIALLLWIYYSAQIFFFGAVLTREYSKRLDRSRRPPGQVA